METKRDPKEEKICYYCIHYKRDIGNKHHGTCLQYNSAVSATAWCVANYEKRSEGAYKEAEIH